MHGRRIPAGYIGIFLLVTGVIVVIAGAAYLNLRSTYIGEKREFLTSLAVEKEAQISGWFRERINDANYFFNNPHIADDIAAARSAGPDPRKGSAVIHDMTSMYMNGRYTGIGLYDTSGALLSAAGSAPAAIRGHARDEARSAGLEGRIGMMDLHEDEDGRPQLLFFVPVRGARDGSGARTATIMLRVDPATDLYPLVLHWPMPNETAECLLIRREGDSLLYLNTLRFRPAAALRLRLPVANDRLPAARAFDGQKGFMEGTDYRGESVFAVADFMPLPSWMLLVKMDRSEALRELNRAAAYIAVSALFLILASGAIIALFFGRQRARYYKLLYEAEREKKALHEHFHYLVQNANDCILLSETDGRIREVNERAAAMYGFSADELRTMSLCDIRSAEARRFLAADIERILNSNGLVYETMHTRRDGGVFPVEVSSKAISIGGDRFIESIIRDISERKAAEQRIARLTKIYRVLSEVNQLIIRTDDRPKLLNEGCRILVEDGGYAFACIGLAEDGSMIPVGCAWRDGAQHENLICSTAHDMGQCSGIGCLAHRSGKELIIRNIGTDPLCAEWRDEALREGFTSCAAFPILRRNISGGYVCVYSSETGVFDDDEAELLRELAADFAYALDYFRVDELRRAAQAETARERDLARMYLDLAGVMIGSLDRNGRIAMMNRRGCEILGYESEDELVGKNWFEHFVPKELQNEIRAVFDSFMQGYGVLPMSYYDNSVVARNGTQRIIAFHNEAIRTEENEITGVVFAGDDITDRRALEEALRTEKEILTAVMEASPAGITVVSRSGEVTYANKRAEAILRLSRSEIKGMRYNSPGWRITGFDGAEFPEENLPVHRVLKDGCMLFDIRHAIETSGGERVLLSINAGPLRDMNGEITGVIAVLEDVTQETLTELKTRILQEERDRALARLKLQIDRMPIALIVTDPDLVIESWNPAAEQIFGYSSSEVIGFSGYDAIIPPEDRPDVREFLSTIKEGDSTSVFVNRNRTRDGRVITCEWHNTPLLGPDGIPLGFLSMAIDITERVEAERARDMFSNASVDLFGIADFSGRFFSVNKAWSDHFGIPEEEILSKPFMSFVHPDDVPATEEAMAALVEGEMIIGFENRYRISGGGYRWLSWNCIPVVGERLIFAVARDMTEWKRAQEKLSSYTERLRALTSRLAAAQETEHHLLARELHDDVGQNLTAMILNLNIIRSQLKIPADADVSRRIDQSIQLAESTIDRTRDIIGTLRPTMLDDYGLFTALKSHIEGYSSLTETPIGITGSDPAIRLSPEKEIALFRIAQEALHNIAKHASASKVLVSLEHDGHSVVLRIEDDGQGFALAEQSVPHAGGGLGLLTMQERAEAVGGRLAISTTEGHGTVVEAIVPAD